MAKVCLSPSESLLCQIVSTCEMAKRGKAFQMLLNELGEAKLLSFAETNQVAPIVGHVILETKQENNLKLCWSEVHEKAQQRLASYFVELDHLATRLADENIFLVALKNGGIARGIFPCIGCCPMGDIDILVEERNFLQAHKILLEENYNFKFRSYIEDEDIKAAKKSGGTEYWKILPNGEKMWFELQWRPIAGRWIRSDQEPSAVDLFARSIPIPDTAVRLLAPEDNLLQVCLHTAKHSYMRGIGFRLHLDVERIVHYQQIDWNVFLERVLQLQVKTPVYFSLVIPKILFDTPIPDYILDRIKPPAWKEKWITAWLNKVGLFNPDERKFNRLGYMVFTALLYDDPSGLLKSIAPDKAWMRQHYGFTNDLILPYYHLRRWVDLVFRRAKT